MLFGAHGSHGALTCPHQHIDWRYLHIKVIGSTSSYYAKMISRQNPLSKVFRSRDNMLSLVDEVQGLSPVEVALCGTYSDGMVVAGDEHQKLEFDDFFLRTTLIS